MIIFLFRYFSINKWRGGGGMRKLWETLSESSSCNINSRININISLWISQ